MNIVWETEGNTLFAVAYNEIINGYQFDELLIAEVNPRLGAYEVRFESAWNDPISCDYLEDAKNLILRDYKQYKPTSLGRNYFLGK